MISEIAVVVNMVGVLVGLGALSVSVWILGFHRELYDTPYLAALYVVGTILVFLSFEVEVERAWGPIFGRTVIFISVAYWEAVVAREVSLGDNGWT